jgi:uncharacterized sulfatase
MKSIGRTKRYLWACLLTAAAACSNASAGPNIVLVLADDQGWRDSGAYGNPDVQTPNIDALASQGMKFTHAFTATAMCAPTRQQLYTGLYPVHSGAYPQNSFVREGTRSLAHYFGELGYRVGISGKRHYAPAESYPFESLNSKDAGEDKEVPEMDLIREFVNRDPVQPFLLLVTSRQPHTPWNKGDVHYAPGELTMPGDMPDTPETRVALSKYYREVSDFDAELGQVMAIVDESGRAQDTIFIYTSEQGAMLPGAKWTLYDDGVRTAFIVRWPGVVEQGSETGALVAYVDVVPTLVEAAGGVAPDVDGDSFLPVLRGAATAHRDYVFGVHTSFGICNGVEYPIRSVRDTRYKLIVNANVGQEFSNNITVRDPANYFASWQRAGESGNAFAAERHLAYRRRPNLEFYDLEIDPHELHNLADSEDYKLEINRLKHVLDTWLEEQGDADPMATERAAKGRILPGGLRKLQTSRCGGPGVNRQESEGRYQE